MAQGGQVFVNFGANTQGLLAGTARAGNILQKFSQTGMGAAVVLGASFVTLSRTMTNFVTTSISGFKDFDFQITRAGALSGSTTEEFKKMRNVAAELGRVTEWTALDASEGMANLALAGFNANEIVQMIPESLRLATAGGVDLAKTNTIMANAMRSFSLEADQANEVSNVLTATFTTTNTTLEGLSQTIKNAAGVLGTVGVKIEEISAAAGVLGDVGILASVAGTGLKNYGIKLAKTFGIMKDATESAKEYFEALGVTKDRMFDAETGTFDMVEATIAFKEAMDKLGKAKAPEFLAQFSTLFGERAAVSLTALVRKAEQFKIQAENVRMTEMIGDVQQVFEQLRGLGGETAYMNNIQEGLSNSVSFMVSKLADADIYMEEFANEGIGAAGVIDRLSKSFKDTQKIMENTFGKDFFTPTRDGLIEINEYSKNGAISMVRLNDILKEMDSVPLGSKRRKELDAERKALEEAVVSGKKDISQLTDQGRARLINLASLREYINGVKESEDGTSKSANQLSALNDVFKGNAQNVAMAARAFGIHISSNDKLKPSLQSVSKEMDKMSNSTEAQAYSLKRLTSQVAYTNTTMDMQAIQLNTLNGVIEIFNSGLEQISNNIAQALTPALGAATKTITNFMQVLTMNSDEIEKGISVSEKLGIAWQDTIKVFTSGESVFSRLKTGFEGLSSIGKNLAIVMGILGVTGVAAGGAFVWVQALLPALGALSSAFFSIVIPVTVLVATLITVGSAFKNAYEQAKTLGDVSNKSIGEIIKAYNSTESIVKGIKSKITELDAQIIKSWLIFNESIKKIKGQLYSLMEPLEKIVGLTNVINITGGKLTIFGKGNNGALVMKDTLTTINDLMEKLGNVSEEQKNKISAAIKSGDTSMVNKMLKETPGLMDNIAKAGLKVGFATENQQKRIKDLNSVIQGRKELQEKINKDLENEISKNDSNIDSQNLISKLKKESAKLEKETNNFILERISLQEEIVTGKGKIGKLTKSELDTLNEVQKAISQRSLNVGKLKMEQERLLKLQKNGVNITQDLNNLNIDLNREHSLLVESQLKYNKILNDSASINPFTLVLRAMREISKTETVKNSILELSNIITAFTKYIADELIPRVFNVSKKFFSILKGSSTDTIIPIFRLVRSLGGLVGDIVKYSLDAIGNLLDYINYKSNNSFGKIGNSINGITNFIDTIRSKIEPIMKMITKILFALYDNIISIIKKIGPSVLNLLKSIGNLFAVVFEGIIKLISNITNSSNKTLDVYGAIAVVIDTIANGINYVSNIIKDINFDKIKPLLPILYSILSFIFLVKPILDFIKNTIIAIHNLSKASEKMLGKLNSISNMKSFEILSNLIENIGRALLTVGGITWAAAIIAGISAVFSAFKNNFGGFKDGLMSTLKWLGGLFAVTGLLIFNVLKNVGKIVMTIVKHLWELGDAIAPLLGIVLAPVLKLAGFILKVSTGIIYGVSKVIDFVLIIVEKAINVMCSLIVSIVNVISKVSLFIYNLMQSIHNKIKEILLNIFSVIKNVFILAVDFIKNAFILIFSFITGNSKEKTGNILSNIKRFVLSIFKEMGNVGAFIEKIIDKVSETFDKVMNSKFMKKVIYYITLIKDTIKLLSSAIFIFIKGIIDFVIYTIKDIAKVIGKIVNVIFELIKSLFNSIKPIIRAIVDFIKMLIGGIKDFIVGIPDRIVNIIDSIWGKIKGVVSSIYSLIKPIFDPIFEFVKGIFIYIYDGMKSLLSSIWNFIKPIFEVLKGIIVPIFAMLKQYFVDFIESLKTFNLKDYLSGMIITAADILFKIYELICTVIDKSKVYIYKIAGDIIKWILDKISFVAGAIPGSVGDNIRAAIEKAKSSVGNVQAEAMAGSEAKLKEKLDSVKAEFDIIKKRALEIGNVNENEKAKKEKAKKEIENQNKKAKDVKGKSKEEKDKKENWLDVIMNGIKGLQNIGDLKTEFKDLGSKVEENSKAKPNITNNTYVEYRAAEDDEVNKRMIERVMNDILKADIGLMMGDTAGMSSD
jgi:TP901 family phage tail tape measure protein